MNIINTIKIVFSFVFALAGSMFLFIGCKEGLKPYRLLKDGVETQGVVIELYKRPVRGNEKSMGSVAPVVQFWTENGEAVKYYSTTFTNFNEYKIGEPVKLWYSAEEPQLATLEGMDNLILPVVFGAFGITMCLIFYPMLIRSLYSAFKANSQ